METCKITLKPLRKTGRNPEYSDAGLKRLFNTTVVDTTLPFSRKEFFTESPRRVSGMSISGVQQKLSLKLDPATHRLEITTVGGEYILKPSPEQYPHAAENEHCAMRLSHELGIETAQCGLVRFKDGEFVYITRRFDRTLHGKSPQEDLLQLAERPSTDKYSLSMKQPGKSSLRLSGKNRRSFLNT